MSKTIKGLLIDPENKAIIAVELEENGDSILSDMRRLLECHNVDVVREMIPGVEVDLWVDDEGLFKDPEYFFAMPKAPEWWLAGKGLLLGFDKLGNCIDCPMTEEQMLELSKNIRFGSNEKIDSEG